MNISKRDKERARKFAKCNCNTFTETLDFTECVDCGFKRSKERVIKKNNKISKRDQLCNKDD